MPPLPSASPAVVVAGLFERVTFVCYSPSTANPLKQVEATPEEVEADLIELQADGFNGLVTYSAEGVLGADLVGLAAEHGFSLIVGVWDPLDVAELDAAIALSGSSRVLAYCVGNEGLDKRYTLPELSTAIATLRERTGKPVTTTEEFGDYQAAQLLELGDWVFPNVHPYFANMTSPQSAVAWTQGAYEDLAERAQGRFVCFKEVGLPTAGDAGLSEQGQQAYYEGLARSAVRFCYFEAFDLPWKDHLPVEPHWGLHQNDRAPKRMALVLRGEDPDQAAAASAARTFVIYGSAEDPHNHYTASGKMGDTGDIEVNPAFEIPETGETCVEVTYRREGQGPCECNYGPPCDWAGIYWLEPANNWGQDAALADAGFDLSGYETLQFRVKADKDCTAEFKIGGIAEPYGDSLTYPISEVVGLTTAWQQVSLKLRGDLSHIIGGFCVVFKKAQVPAGGCRVYLDDIILK